MLAALNADERMEPASITKLMTAYIVFKALAEKRLALDEPVMISEYAWRPAARLAATLPAGRHAWCRWKC